jgi:signal recognition particle subunit SRP54
MSDAFKMMSRGGGKGLAQMARMMGAGGPGGMPGMGGMGGLGGPDLARLKALGGGKLPQPDPNAAPQGGPTLPGLGGGFPGLPGFKPKK